MTTRIFILTLILVTGRGLKSQSKSFFPNLTRISLDTSNKVYFNYDRKNIYLINKPCYELDKKHFLYCKKDEVLAAWTLVANYKNESLKDSVLITYTEGMSVDPMFVVISKTNRMLGRFSCKEFYINSSGTIYTSGHTNNLYDRKRKFQLQNDTVLEVVQPFYYVGLKGKLLKEITLYKDKAGKDIVAQLPKNYEIEILLGESSVKEFESDLFLLVKTDFGLTGWMRLEQEGLYSGILKDLYYAGD